MSIPEKPSGLALVLSSLFLLSMVMGSGPGLRLINPDYADPNAVFTVAGLPIIYLWGLFWYGIQLAVILTAYSKIWKKADAAGAEY
jgi:hypothetical protein